MLMKLDLLMFNLFKKSLKILLSKYIYMVETILVCSMILVFGSYFLFMGLYPLFCQRPRYNIIET